FSIPKCDILRILDVVSSARGEAMRRRELIALAGCIAAAWPLAARAQQSAKPHRIGYLWGGIEATEKDHIAEFNAGMRDLGHVEGQDFVFDARFADGHFERLPSLAKELLALNPDVLFVGTTPANLAAKAATPDCADRHGSSCGPDRRRF